MLYGKNMQVSMHFKCLAFIPVTIMSHRGAGRDKERRDRMGIGAGRSKGAKEK
jgi:hypothetical protein